MKISNTTYEHEEYKILNLTPAKNLHAVFADETEDGTYKFVSWPIFFVAVCQYTIDTDISNEIYGVILSEGNFEIVNEHPNFVGLMHEDDPIDTTIIGYWKHSATSRHLSEVKKSQVIPDNSRID